MTRRLKARYSRFRGGVGGSDALFQSLGVLDDRPTVTVPGAPVVDNPFVSCDSNRVLSLYAGHLQLTAVHRSLPMVKNEQ